MEMLWKYFEFKISCIFLKGLSRLSCIDDSTSTTHQHTMTPAQTHTHCYLHASSVQSCCRHLCIKFSDWGALLVTLQTHSGQSEQGRSREHLISLVSKLRPKPLLKGEGWEEDKKGEKARNVASDWGTSTCKMIWNHFIRETHHIQLRKELLLHAGRKQHAHWNL